MSLIEIVNKLEELGHQVSYRVRTDGGIIITEINGTKYTGAKGNAIARTIVGANLSSARKSQLEGIKPKAGRGRKLTQPDDELKKMVRRIQRKWKKNVDSKKGKITLSKVRWNIEHLGRDRAIEKLLQAERYALGLAYDENINALVNYIQMASNRLGNPEALETLIEAIETHRATIKEDSIKAVYDELYSLNDGDSPEDVANRIRAILGI